MTTSERLQEIAAIVEEIVNFPGLKETDSTSNEAVSFYKCAKMGLAYATSTINKLENYPMYAVNLLCQVVSRLEIFIEPGSESRVPLEAIGLVRSCFEKIAEVIPVIVGEWKSKWGEK